MSMIYPVGMTDERARVIQEKQWRLDNRKAIAKKVVLWLPQVVGVTLFVLGTAMADKADDFKEWIAPKIKSAPAKMGDVVYTVGFALGVGYVHIMSWIGVGLSYLRKLGKRSVT